MYSSSTVISKTQKRKKKKVDNKPCQIVEGVADDAVACGAEGQTHSVLAALDVVVLEGDVGGLQRGESRVLKNSTQSM